MKPSERRVRMPRISSAESTWISRAMSTRSALISRTPSISPPRASAPYTRARARALPCPLAPGISAARQPRLFGWPATRAEDGISERCVSSRANGESGSSGGSPPSTFRRGEMISAMR